MLPGGAGRSRRCAAAGRTRTPASPPGSRARRRRTTSSICSSFRERRTSTRPPSRVNWMAFESRFAITCCMRCTSACARQGSHVDGHVDRDVLDERRVRDGVHRGAEEERQVHRPRTDPQRPARRRATRRSCPRAGAPAPERSPRSSRPPRARSTSRPARMSAVQLCDGLDRQPELLSDRREELDRACGSRARRAAARASPGAARARAPSASGSRAARALACLLQRHDLALAGRGIVEPSRSRRQGRRGRGRRRPLRSSAVAVITGEVPDPVGAEERHRLARRRARSTAPRGARAGVGVPVRAEHVDHLAEGPQTRPSPRCRSIRRRACTLRSRSWTHRAEAVPIRRAPHHEARQHLVRVRQDRALRVERSAADRSRRARSRERRRGGRSVATTIEPIARQQRRAAEARHRAHEKAGRLRRTAPRGAGSCCLTSMLGEVCHQLFPSPEAFAPLPTAGVEYRPRRQARVQAAGAPLPGRRESPPIQE